MPCLGRLGNPCLCVGMPLVNPLQMVWARETAGLTRERAAAALAIQEERLAELEESGEPSGSQLAAMVKLYRRPLLVFYLAEPPAPSKTGEDFRSSATTSRDPDMEARLVALLRDIRTRQLLIRNVLIEDEEAVPIDFIGSLGRNVPRAALLAAMREILDTPISELRAQRTPEDTFKILRRSLEDKGIFVLLAGDLGSSHSAIDNVIFRGFAIADKWAPFIVINDKDAKTAWSFTLLHELAHLLTGAGGVSGSNSGADVIERLCNDVAGEFLLPNAELDKLGELIAGLNNPQEITPLVIQFANERRVSPDLVAYRSLRGRLLDQPTWIEVQRLLSERLQRLRQERIEQPARSGGANYYIVRRHRLGNLVSFTRRALSTGALSPTKAALVLGVKPRNVRTLVEAG